MPVYLRCSCCYFMNVHHSWLQANMIFFVFQIKPQTLSRTLYFLQLTSYTVTCPPTRWRFTQGQLCTCWHLSGKLRTGQTVWSRGIFAHSHCCGLQYFTQAKVCRSNNEEMVYDFPCGHLKLLHHLMSSCSSLDHGPGFPAHYMPTIKQSIKKDPPLVGLNYTKLAAVWWQKL